MPILNNPTTGGLVYTPGEYFAPKILDVDRAVTASTTLVTVPQFTLALGRGERLVLRHTIFYTTNATADFKYRLDVPGTPTIYRTFSEQVPPAATAITVAPLTAEADQTLLAASGTEGFLRITSYIVGGTTSSDAGDVIFQFAQNTSDAGATTLRAGSHVEYFYF